MPMAFPLEDDCPSVVLRQGGQIAEKVARSETAKELLQNEAVSLQTLAGLKVPQFVGLYERADQLVLRRAFVPGVVLADVEWAVWPPLLRQVTEALKPIHTRGLVHGDLRPDNIIVSGNDVVLIDWEHALPIGAGLAERPLRAVSLGYTHPRQIWGQGDVDAELDFHAVARMGERVAAL